ncbi:hypothetical protein L6452_36409 [Arctium lappa]|uniref:Uncharacterized protein n=1 Tax=Arctium lappa TaxID=4217 RepID=A0ACB8YA83_ARCLA|nr:hypothetical protein L6452_36409 [Arctium lappa]
MATGQVETTSSLHSWGTNTSCYRSLHSWGTNPSYYRHHRLPPAIANIVCLLLSPPPSGRSATATLVRLLQLPPSSDCSATATTVRLLLLPPPSASCYYRIWRDVIDEPLVQVVLQCHFRPSPSENDKH